MMKDKSQIESFYKNFNRKVSKCYAPGEECPNKAIKAHSIQNSKVFDLLNEEDHVIGLNIKTDKEHFPNISFSKIGRNKASTFEGLCEKHDQELFKLIDKSEINISNNEQLFLLAYRSVLKELHASIAKAYKIHFGYQSLIENNEAQGNQPSEADVISTQMWIDAYEASQYKETFDKALLSKNFNFLTHWVFKIETEIPLLACSQLFSVDSVTFNDSVLRMILNVFPVTNNLTIVIFTSRIEEKGLAEDYLVKCLNNIEAARNYEISKLILRNTENFFLNPVHFKSWSELKKETILEYLIETIFKDIEKDDKEYYLF